jgi:hypothetical protein
MMVIGAWIMAGDPERDRCQLYGYMDFNNTIFIIMWLIIYRGPSY